MPHPFWLSRRPLLASLALALAASCAILATFPRLLPLLHLSLTATPQQVRAQAQALNAQRLWLPQDARVQVSLQREEDLADFVEREGGAEALQQWLLLTAGGAAADASPASLSSLSPLSPLAARLSPWFWQVRLIAPGSAAVGGDSTALREVRLHFAPDGRLMGFALEAEAKQEDHQADADRVTRTAQALLGLLQWDAGQEAALQAQLRALGVTLDWSQWHLVGAESLAYAKSVQAVYEYAPGGKTWQWQGAGLLLHLRAVNGALTHWQWAASLPDLKLGALQILQDAAQKRRAIATLAVLVWGVLLSVLALLLLRRAGQRLPLRLSAAVASTVAALDLAMQFMRPDWRDIALDIALRFSVLWLGFFVLLLAALGLTQAVRRSQTAQHPQIAPLFLTAAQPSFLRRVLLGYALALAFLAFFGLKQWFLRDLLHYWAASPLLHEGLTLSAPWPFLVPLVHALSSSLSEEAMFRALPLALALWVAQRFGRAQLWLTLALLLQTALFAFAHTGQANEPVWCHALDAALAALLFAGLFLRFGFWLPVWVHGLVNLLWFSLPLLALPPATLIAQILPLITVALAPLLWHWWARQRYASPVPDAAEPVPSPQPEPLPQWHRAQRLRPLHRFFSQTSVIAAEKKPVSIARAQATAILRAGSRWRLGALRLIVPAALLLWWFSPPPAAFFPALTLSRDQAQSAALKEFARLGLMPGAHWRVDSLALGGDDAASGVLTQRLLQQFGREALQPLLAAGYLSPPHWRVRYGAFEPKAGRHAWISIAADVANDGSVSNIQRYYMPSDSDAQAQQISETAARLLARAALLNIEAGGNPFALNVFNLLGLPPLTGWEPQSRSDSSEEQSYDAAFLERARQPNARFKEIKAAPLPLREREGWRLVFRDLQQTPPPGVEAVLLVEIIGARVSGWRRELRLMSDTTLGVTQSNAARAPLLPSPASLGVDLAAFAVLPLLFLLALVAALRAWLRREVQGRIWRTALAVLLPLHALIFLNEWPRWTLGMDPQQAFASQALALLLMGLLQPLLLALAQALVVAWLVQLALRPELGALPLAAARQIAVQAASFTLFALALFAALAARAAPMAMHMDFGNAVNAWLPALQVPLLVLRDTLVYVLLGLTLAHFVSRAQSPVWRWLALALPGLAFAALNAAGSGTFWAAAFALWLLLIALAWRWLLALLRHSGLRGAALALGVALGVWQILHLLQVARLAAAPWPLVQ